MAKGNTCPECGEQTFHKQGAIWQCGKCGAVGFVGKPTAEGRGSGKGDYCHNCEGSTLRALYEESFTLKHCSSCDAVVVLT